MKQYTPQEYEARIREGVKADARRALDEMRKEGWVDPDTQRELEEIASGRKIPEMDENWNVASLKRAEKDSSQIFRRPDETTVVAFFTDGKGNRVPYEEAMYGGGYVRNNKYEILETLTYIPPRLKEALDHQAQKRRQREAQQATSSESEASRSAQYALAVSIGEAKYDTKEQLRDAWRRHMESQGLHLPPEELRRRFIVAHARWKTSPEMLSSVDAAFFQACL